MIQAISNKMIKNVSKTTTCATSVSKWS